VAECFGGGEMDDLRANLQIVPRGTIVFSELGVF
jgi:hypothetical protein